MGSRVPSAAARAADGDGAWLAFEKARTLGLKPERDERVISSVLCAFARTKEVRQSQSSISGNIQHDLIRVIRDTILPVAGASRGELLPERGQGVAREQAARSVLPAPARRRGGGGG